MTDTTKAKPMHRGWVADLCALAGLGLVSYGAWLLHPAAGFIVCGALLLIAGIVGSLRGGA